MAKAAIVAREKREASTPRIRGFFGEEIERHLGQLERPPDRALLIDEGLVASLRNGTLLRATTRIGRSPVNRSQRPGWSHPGG